MKRLSFIPLILLAATAHAFDLGGLKEQLGKAAQSPSQTSQTANSAGLSGISNADQVGSLKQALTQGAETAVAGLAKENGFLGNDKVRIPLPDSLQKAGKLMHSLGMGKYADDLTSSMNRAAEAAVPDIMSAIKAF